MHVSETIEIVDVLLGVSGSRLSQSVQSSRHIGAQNIEAPNFKHITQQHPPVRTRIAKERPSSIQHSGLVASRLTTTRSRRGRGETGTGHPRTIRRTDCSHRSEIIPELRGWRWSTGLVQEPEEECRVPFLARERTPKDENEASEAMYWGVSPHRHHDERFREHSSVYVAAQDEQDSPRDE